MTGWKFSGLFLTVNMKIPKQSLNSFNHPNSHKCILSISKKIKSFHKADLCGACLWDLLYAAPKFTVMKKNVTFHNCAFLVVFPTTMHSLWHRGISYFRLGLINCWFWDLLILRKTLRLSPHLSYNNRCG